MLRASSVQVSLSDSFQKQKHRRYFHAHLRPGWVNYPVVTVSCDGRGPARERMKDGTRLTGQYDAGLGELHLTILHPRYHHEHGRKEVCYEVDPIIFLDWDSALLERHLFYKFEVKKDVKIEPVIAWGFVQRELCRLFETVSILLSH